MKLIQKTKGKYILLHTFY